MARSLTPVQFVDRPRPEPRHRREAHHLATARDALARLAHTLRHPRLRHVGHGTG